MKKSYLLIALVALTVSAPAFANTGIAAGQLTPATTVAKEAVKGTVEAKKDAVKGAVEAKKEAVKDAVEAKKEAVTDKVEATKEAVTEKKEAVKEKVMEKAAEKLTTGTLPVAPTK